jgi:hypothetical protein
MDAGQAVASQQGFFPSQKSVAPVSGSAVFLSTFICFIASPNIIKFYYIKNYTKHFFIVNMRNRWIHEKHSSAQ